VIFGFIIFFIAEKINPGPKPPPVPRGDPRSPSSPATSPTPRPKQPPVPRGAPPATFLAGYVPDAEAEAASHAPRGSPATFLPGNVPDDEPEAAPRSALPPLRHQSRLRPRGATASSPSAPATSSPAASSPTPTGLPQTIPQEQVIRPC
jgi:hypothetical protein